MEEKLIKKGKKKKKSLVVYTCTEQQREYHDPCFSATLWNMRNGRKK